MQLHAAELTGEFDVLPDDFKLNFIAGDAMHYKNTTTDELDTVCGLCDRVPLDNVGSDCRNWLLNLLCTSTQFFGNIAGTISDLTASIVRELESKVRRGSHAHHGCYATSQIMEFGILLEATSASLGELDALISLAMCAVDYNYVRPVVTTGTAIRIKVRP